MTIVHCGVLTVGLENEERTVKHGIDKPEMDKLSDVYLLPFFY